TSLVRGWLPDDHFEHGRSRALRDFTRYVCARACWPSSPGLRGLAEAVCEPARANIGRSTRSRAPDSREQRNVAHARRSGCKKCGIVFQKSGAYGERVQSLKGKAAARGLKIPNYPALAARRKVSAGGVGAEFGFSQ